jgi:hypothetical protein
MVPSISFSGRECRHADEIFAFPARTEFSELEEIRAQRPTRGACGRILRNAYAGPEHSTVHGSIIVRRLAREYKYRELFEIHGAE